MGSPESDPPESLPKYLAEGVPKQDIETLESLHKWVDEILEYRHQEIREDELPDEAELVREDDKGTIVEEKVKCGDESCACMSGGEKHGPYRYRYYYERGELKSEYLGKA